MSDDLMTPLKDVMKELDALPPDDPKRILLNAFRELEAGALRGWNIEGEIEDGAARNFLQIVTLGLLGESWPPKFFVRPGSGAPEDQEILDKLVLALGKEPRRRTPLESLKHLVGHPVRTLVIASYSLKAGGGAPVIELWHHPELKLPQAVHLAFVGIESEAANRTKSS